MLLQTSANDRERLDDLIAGTLDSLLYLARNALPNAEQAYSTLERLLPLIGFASTAENMHQLTSFHYGKCVSAGYYNLGGLARQSIVGSNGDSVAIRFLRRSCDIAGTVLAAFSGNEGAEDLRNSMAARYSLLASCYIGIGDRKVRDNVLIRCRYTH